MMNIAKLAKKNAKIRQDDFACLCENFTPFAIQLKKNNYE